MTAAASKIRLEHVSYRYPGATRDAIHDASLEVGPSEFVGVVGPNGGGKTTLVRLLLGLARPQSGTIEILGRTPLEARDRIGYVPQQAQIDAGVPATVFDIVLAGRLGRSSWGPRYGRCDIEQARRALAATDTADLESRPWSTLSGGQRQRVLIARALAAEAEILVLDEPTSGVDLHREQKLLTLLHEVNERMPVLMVSHDLALVQTHMDQAIWVSGTVVARPAHELTIAAVERFFHGSDSCHPVERTANPR
jgi:zinc transport system ATP-binding protein